MQGIDELKRKLETDIYTALTVESKDGTDRPMVNFTKADIIKNFGSINDFFEVLKRDFSDYKIIEKRQNGTFTKGGKTKISYKTVRQVYPEIQSEAVPSSDIVFPTGLNAPNAFGLSVPELIALNIDRKEKERLLSENNKLTQELERLKRVEKDYEDLKRSIEYNDKKEEKTTTILTSFLSSPVAEKLAEGFAGLINKNGLNAPTQVVVESPQDKFISEYSILNENEKNLFRNIMYLSKNKEGFFDTLADLVISELNTEPN